MLLVWLAACMNAPCVGVEGPRLTVSPQTGGADGNRFATIADALLHAQPGTTVCVEEGHYLEPIGLWTDGVELRGAGPDHVLVEVEGGTGVQMGAHSSVSGLRIQGAETGVHVAPGVMARLQDIDVVDADIAVLATDPKRLHIYDAHLDGARRVGLIVTATGASAYQQVVVERTSFQDNGAMDSEVGALYSDMPLALRDVTFANNHGELAADVLARRSLTLERVRMDRPTSTTAPRVVADDGLTASDTTAWTSGATALDVRCVSSGLDLSNVAIADAAGGTPALVADGCTGRIVHSTLATLAGEEQAALVLTGHGDIELTNDAWIGNRGVDTTLHTGALHQTNGFVGSVAEARLLGPLPASPDLRPQSDSPLVDSGIELGVLTDVDGRPRPSGDAPDIGAYELY